MDFCMAERKSKEVNKSELKVHDRQKKKEGKIWTSVWPKENQKKSTNLN